MELRRYLSIISAYRWPLAVVPLVAALIAFAATYSISPKFVAVATVQLIPEDTEPRTVSLRSADGSSTVATGFRDPSELLAQGVIESLASRDVAEFVLQRVGPVETERPTGIAALKASISGAMNGALDWLRYGYTARADDAEATVDGIRSALHGDLVRGSYYMRISAGSPNPEMAAALANSAVDGFLAHSRRLASAAAAERRQFLDQQLVDAKRRVSDARAAAMDYSSSNGLVPIESLRASVAALDQARGALQQNELAVVTARARLASAEEELSNTNPDAPTVQTMEGTTDITRPAVPTTATSVVRMTSPNPAYDSLQERVQDLQQEVASLEQRQDQTEAQQQGESARALAATKRRLELVEQELARTSAEVTTVQIMEANNQGAGTTRTTIPNPVYQALQERALNVRQEVAELEAHQANTQSQLRGDNQRALADARGRLATAQAQLAVASPTLVSEQVTQAPALPDPTAPTRAATRTTTSSPNPVYQALEQHIHSLHEEVKGLETGRDMSTAQVSQQQQALQDLVGRDGKLAELNQDLTAANDAYNRLSIQWQNALLEEARPVSQIRVINRASPPVYPASPIKIVWALIGAVAGLLVASVWVFVRHGTDLTLHSVADAEAALGHIRLLAVVPTPDNGHARRAGVGAQNGR